MVVIRPRRELFIILSAAMLFIYINKNIFILNNNFRLIYNLKIIKAMTNHYGLYILGSSCVIMQIKLKRYNIEKCS